MSEIQAGSAMSAPQHRPAAIPSAISADLMAFPSLVQRMLLLSMVSLVVVFVAWASLASVQEVTTGRGRVTPASKIQVVQNLEGGIVREVLVREGGIVREGDVLVRIDPTIAGSSLGEAREKLVGLTALIARLEAEVEGKPLQFPPEIVQARPDIVAYHREHHDSRRNEIEAATAAFDLQEKQRAQEIREVQSKIGTLRRALEIAEDELELIRPLERTRAASRSELLAAEAKANDIRGALQGAELSIPRLEAAVAEIGRRRAERLEAFRGEALQRLASARTEQAALGEASRGNEDKLARTTVRAPTAGVVKSVFVTTPGQVVQPGHSLAEIVPANDTLLVEAQVRPQDIAFLRPGQDALVKITAYDFALFGGLPAKVEHIGADSISTDRGDTYYLIRVRTDRAHLQHSSGNLPIIPGMVADVDVITGSKTVLGYLMKPLVRMRQSALRER
ncbi:MAG: HlyD family type I secretion periplasmic adaptor subunit [Hyphomicrobiales bacterium]|nr:HlyD family type I secretion periplasmic adaptor subunit [Hyphomicrobiales bacterium]